MKDDRQFEYQEEAI